jgi:hypothetical protein
MFRARMLAGAFEAPFSRPKLALETENTSPITAIILINFMAGPLYDNRLGINEGIMGRDLWMQLPTEAGSLRCLRFLPPSQFFSRILCGSTSTFDLLCTLQ